MATLKNAMNGVSSRGMTSKKKGFAATASKKRGLTSWKDTMYVAAYRHARSGMSEKAIAEALGITFPTYAKYKADKPAFAQAIFDGKSARERSASTDLGDAIRGRLPKHLLPVLDKIVGWQSERNGVRKTERLLAAQGKLARQYMFLYALPTSGFNVSRACRFAAISRATFDSWVTEDDGFSELMSEIIAARKDAYEEFLYTAAEKGDTAAILFGNRTLNRDRGYSDKVVHEHSGTINHNVTVLDLAKLDLPLDVRKAILDAARTAGLVPMQPAVHKLIETTAEEIND